MRPNGRGAGSARNRHGPRTSPPVLYPDTKGNHMATWLITGCSTGLGRALAMAVLDRGETVVVTARDAARAGDLTRAHPVYRTRIAARCYRPRPDP